MSVVGVEIGTPYDLVGPDGVIASFNDRDASSWVGYLTGVAGLDSAEVRENADVIPEGDGGVHGDFFEGRRPVTLEGLIHPEPRPDLDCDEDLTLLATNLAVNPAAGDGTTTGWANVSLPSFAPVTLGQGGAPVASAALAALGVTTALACTGDFSSDGAELSIPVVAGHTYRFSTYVYIASLTGGAAVRLRVWDGGVVVKANGPDVTTTSQWVRTDVGFTADATTTLTFRVCQVFAGTASWWHTAVLVQESATLGAYFDGDTYPAGFPDRTVWTGAPNNSPSVLYNVARTTWSGPRTVNDRIDRLKRASRALRDDAVLAWTPSGGVPVQLAVRRQQPLRIADRLPKTFQVGLVAADPRIFSQELHTSQVIAGAAQAGGLGSPLTSPLTSGQSVAGEVLVDNAGTAGTPPVLRVYGPGTNPAVRHADTGAVLAFSYTLAAGEFLEIDVAARTVTLNGSSSRYSALVFASSTWFELDPGENTLRLEWASVGAGASLVVEWRDAWT